ncbi:11247_t:CDS:2, partial [Dentiscutata erythropus]
MPLPLLRVRTKPAKRYQSSLPITHKLLANKSNEQSNHLSNLENLNKYSNDNDLSDSEQYSNKSNELDQYSSETYQYSSESDKDVDWEISEEEYFLDNYENYLHDNDNDLTNSDNNNTAEEIEQINERQLLRADSLVLYHGLPEHLRSNNRKTREMGIELWLVEGQEYLIIPENITSINVWLKNLNRLAEYEYFVTEILYSFNGWWHIRDLIKKHKAPYEYIPIPPLPPRPMPIKK